MMLAAAGCRDVQSTHLYSDTATFQPQRLHTIDISLNVLLQLGYWTTRQRQNHRQRANPKTTPLATKGRGGVKMNKKDLKQKTDGH